MGSPVGDIATKRPWNRPATWAMARLCTFMLFVYWMMHDVDKTDAEWFGCGMVVVIIAVNIEPIKRAKS